MQNRNVFGYTVHTSITHFTPNTVLFSCGSDRITVSMVNNVLDYVIGYIAVNSSLSESYKKAKTVLTVMKMRLCNKQLSQPSKKDIEITVDVLKEIFNTKAKSEQ